MRIIVFLSGLLFAVIQNLIFQVLVWTGVFIANKVGVDVSLWSNLHTIALATIIQCLFFVRELSDVLYYDICGNSDEE